MDWENIKLKTLEKIHELLLQRPDLNCSLQMRPTQHMPTLSEIIPLGYLSSLVVRGGLFQYLDVVQFPDPNLPCPILLLASLSFFSTFTT